MKKINAAIIGYGIGKKHFEAIHNYKKARVTIICEKNLKENEAEKIFFSMLENEKKNGLSEKLINDSILDFKQRVKETKWLDHYKQNPFKKSGSALYKWAPIADDLKVLDKEIVLNSIMLKWNLVENEFKELTKNLNFK